MTKKLRVLPNESTESDLGESKVPQLHTAKSLVFSVSLGTGCYRHIRISAYATLKKLHLAIQAAFNFDDDHAYAFYMDNRTWRSADAYHWANIDGDQRVTSDYALHSIGLWVGQPFKYVFDFGDCWTFQLKLLKILDQPTEDAQIIRCVGAAPAQYFYEDDDDDDDEFVDDNDEEEYDDDFDKDEDDKDDGKADSNFVYPKVYPAEKLEALHQALLLPADPKTLLRDYFDAFAFLYEIIPLRKALEIYNKQNPPIDEEVFAQFSDILRHEEPIIYSILGQDDLYGSTKGAYLPLDREIIMDNLLMADDAEEYEKLKALQEGKPYYVPEKSELLRYAQDYYFEDNASFYAMVKFLRSQMKLTEKKAIEMTMELQLHASMSESDIDFILDDLDRLGMAYIKAMDRALFWDEYTKLFNDTRMAMNRGHTPNELMGT